MCQVTEIVKEVSIDGGLGPCVAGPLPKKDITPGHPGKRQPVCVYHTQSDVSGDQIQCFFLLSLITILQNIIFNDLMLVGGVGEGFTDNKKVKKKRVQL